METHRRAVQVARWLSAGMLLLGALYFFNLAAFHTWAASGPPTPNREWHEAWATRFRWTTVAFLVASIGVVWLLRKGNQAATRRT